MPALDFLNKTATVTHDITNSASASATALLLGRSALPDDLYVVVAVTEASIANFTTRTLKAAFEYTTDNGTTYFQGGGGSMTCGPNTSGIPLQMKAFPVGLLDIDPEQKTAANIKWRVTMTLSSTLSTTDTYDFVAYLHSGPIGSSAASS